jgi:ankyrin repeat protein
LELAAASGALEAVRLLLARGAMIDAQPSSGKTALHAAARAAQVETAHFLVDAGANVSLVDRSERLAFEVVPDEKAAEFIWLAEISKASRKLQGKESHTLPKPRQPQQALDLSDW